jgi:3-hydroxypropionyl-CoA synthetase (ADP-forming)
MGGPFTEKISERIEETNVPVYHSVTEWVTAAGALTKWTRIRGQAK